MKIKLRHTNPQKIKESINTDFLPILSESLPKGREKTEATAVNIRYSTGTNAA